MLELQHFLSALPQDFLIAYFVRALSLTLNQSVGGGNLTLCTPKNSEQRSRLPCGFCGRHTELFELPGRADRPCLSCDADLAISEQ